MPASSRSLMLPARLGALQALRQFVDSFCGGVGATPDDCSRLNLVLEELFTNTVRHGHRSESDAPVWITLALRGGRVMLDYEDTASPFNPYGSPDETLRMPRHGGLGVRLTKKLAAEQEYAYIFGRNCVRLKLALG